MSNFTIPPPTQKDPRGLISADLHHLSKVFPRKVVTPKTTQEEVMYDAGIQSVLEYIKNKMTAGRE